MYELLPKASQEDVNNDRWELTGRGGQLQVCYSLVVSMWRGGIRVQEAGVNVQHINI